MPFQTINVDLDEETIRLVNTWVQELQVTLDTYINPVLLNHLENRDVFEIVSSYLTQHPDITKALTLEETWRILGRA